MTYQEVKRKHELALANDFAQFISTTSEQFDVIERPDPPDAILKSDIGNFSWIEITDIFRSHEEAQEAYSYATGTENTYNHHPEVIINPDLKINHKTIEGVERKINKQSYQKVLSQYGKGILILWIDDPLFTDDTLKVITSTFNQESLNSHYFKEVYFTWKGCPPGMFIQILSQT